MCLAEANLSFPVHSLTMKRSNEKKSPVCNEVRAHEDFILWQLNVVNKELKKIKQGRCYEASH